MVKLLEINTISTILLKTKHTDSWKQFYYDVNEGTLMINYTVYCIPVLWPLSLQTSVVFVHDYTN